MLLSLVLVLALLQVGVTLAAPLSHEEEDVVNAMDRLSVDQLQHLFDALKQRLHSLEDVDSIEAIGGHQIFQSCKNLSEGATNGYYLIRNSTNHLNREYCDTSVRFLGGELGWMRVAHLNTSNCNHQCPSGLRMQQHHRRCVRNTTDSGCTSVTYPTNGIAYSRVCGKIRAIQDSHPTGFRPFIERNTLTLEDSYVDGVSITHGSAGSRNHIWTFATSYSDNSMQCSCSDFHNVPSFVGHDFFCETGSRAEFEYDDITFDNDPLWDGEGCDSQSDCCRFNSPPWFCKQLPAQTTDDIEMRVCLNELPIYGDVLLEAVDILVQ